jgi:hypothetical protein
LQPTVTSNEVTSNTSATQSTYLSMSSLTIGQMTNILTHKLVIVTKPKKACVACRKANCPYIAQCPGLGNRALCVCVKFNHHSAAKWFFIIASFLFLYLFKT